MRRMNSTIERRKPMALCLMIACLLLSGWISTSPCAAATPDSDVSLMKSVGRQAAIEAVSMMRSHLRRFNPGGCLAMTNAGYAEIDDRSTMGALDGLSQVLGVSRGDHSLIEVHSDANQPLWFAIYHLRTGYCAYLETDPDAVDRCGQRPWTKCKRPLFAYAAMERIDADHLFANAAEYAEKFNDVECHPG